MKNCYVCTADIQISYFVSIVVYMNQRGMNVKENFLKQDICSATSNMSRCLNLCFKYLHTQNQNTGAISSGLLLN